MAFFNHGRSGIYPVRRGVFIIALLVSAREIEYSRVAYFILNDVWIVFLAVMDYQRTGAISWYQLIAAIFIIYALTLGKSDMKKLDVVIKRKVAEKRGVSVE